MTVYMVSTPGAKRSGHHKFLASDKKQLHLPADMSLLHMEYTDYYFPDGVDYPGICHFRNRTVKMMLTGSQQVQVLWFTAETQQQFFVYYN